MLETLRNAWKVQEIRKKILYTLLMLFVFRLGSFVPVPWIDSTSLRAIVEGNSVLALLNMFNGGALQYYSFFAAGITPYITASIVIQLLTVAIPKLEAMQKEGEEGRKRITQYTRYGTVAFALIQAIGMVSWLRGLGVFYGGILDGVLAMATVTTGSVAVMWLGEVMSDHGIGNGISMLIFAGIVARIPGAIAQTFTMVRMGEMNILVVLLALAIMVAVVAGCVMLQEGQRKIPVQYAKRVVGNRIYGGQSTYIPLRVNTAGVIPIIFASSVLLFPYTVARFFPGAAAEAVQRAFSPGSPIYVVLYVVLIVFFAYFYTAVVFNPAELAENMKKYGGFVLGIRPGKPTADYIEKVMARITLGGALALAVVALVPTVMSGLLNVNTFYFGGTSVLIVVGVALDTVHQLEGQLLMRHYEGILKRRGGKSGGLLKL